jgi:hypothetical protein
MQESRYKHISDTLRPGYLLLPEMDIIHDEGSFIHNEYEPVQIWLDIVIRAIQMALPEPLAHLRIPNAHTELNCSIPC